MWKLNLIQIVLASISLFFLVDRLARFFRREKAQSLFKFVAFVIIWLMVLLVSLFPTLAYTISRSLGMGESLNTLIFAGFIVVFAIIYKLLNIIERLERNITEIVRKEALKDLKTKI